MQINSRIIKAEAKRLGFSFIGISAVKPPPHTEFFNEWIEKGMAGNLDYLSKKNIRILRNHPEKILQGAESIIVVGVHYHPSIEKYVDNPAKIKGEIASYAMYEDYHAFFRKKIQEMTKWIKELAKDDALFKLFVDSSPVPEKGFAYIAGLGWIGKNSLLIHPDFGSFCLIGCIFTDLKLTPDLPLEGDVCRNCSRCVTACPTGAINLNRTLDARKCISYLTIEHKDIIPKELRPKIGNHVFGCDTCQSVCPANQKVFNRQETKPSLHPILSGSINLIEEFSIGKEIFKAKYGQSPLSRIRHEIFLRNIATAMGNIGSGVFVETLSLALHENQSAIVRIHTAWALGQINTKASLDHLKLAATQEPDTQVEEEILSAIDKLN